MDWTEATKTKRHFVGYLALAVLVFAPFPLMLRGNYEAAEVVALAALLALNIVVAAKRIIGTGAELRQ